MAIDSAPYNLNPEQIEELRKKVAKLNKKYKLDKKGIKLAVSKTQAGNTTVSFQTNANVWGNYFKDVLKISTKKSAPPTVDGLNQLEKFVKQIVKTDIFKNYDKSAAMKAGGVKSGLKQLKDLGSKKTDVFRYLLLNENASVADLARDLKIKASEVKKNLQGLYTDIYKRIGDQGAAYLKQFNSSELEKAHDAIKNSGVRLKDRVKNLVTDAYKGDKNLKPLLEKLDNFYTQMAEVKKQPFGKFFAGNLDHPVPLNFIRQLEAGADPVNLIKIRPIPEFLNQRAFKAQFDRVLGTAYRTKNKKALEAIVNLQSYLPKEFGGITVDGKIADYGAKPFNLKTNLSVAKFPEVYQRVFEFINNPELQSTFKESKVSFKNLKSQEALITKMSTDFLKYRKNLLADAVKGGAVCQIFRKAGGRIGFANGTSCTLEVEEALKRDPKKFSQSVNQTEGVAPKIKNSATKFLTALKENPNIFKGKFGTLAAVGVGTVAAGVGAGALVKQFRNDDPSTYLTNDNQMEGMIISDVEQKGEEVDDNILLDNQFKLEAAAAAGLTTPIAGQVYRTARQGTPPLLESPLEFDNEIKTLKRTIRQITHPGGKKAKRISEAGQEVIRNSKIRISQLQNAVETAKVGKEGSGVFRSALGLEKGVLGKGLWALGAPIIQVPSTIGYIAKDVREGKDVGEIATNPLNYLGAAFMNPSVKALARAGASRGLLGIASLGLAGTALGAVALPAISIGAGLATLGTLGYQGYKLFSGMNKTSAKDDFFK